MPGETREPGDVVTRTFDPPEHPIEVAVHRRPRVAIPPGRDSQSLLDELKVLVHRRLGGLLDHRGMLGTREEHRHSYAGHERVERGGTEAQVGELPAAITHPRSWRHQV